MPLPTRPPYDVRYGGLATRVVWTLVAGTSPPSLISRAYLLAVGAGALANFGWRPTNHRPSYQELKSVNCLTSLQSSVRPLFLVSFLAIQGSVILLLEPSVRGVKPEDRPVLSCGIGGDAFMLRAGKLARELTGQERRSPGSLHLERRVSQRRGKKERRRRLGEGHNRPYCGLRR